MAVNDTEEYFAVLEGTERITNLVHRYCIFENLYIRGAHSVDSKANKGLKMALKNLYKVILSYRFEARR